MADVETINESLIKDADKYLRYADLESERVADRVSRIRMEIYEILEAYETKDGTISKSRIESLIRQLNNVELGVYNELTESMDAAIEKVATDVEKDTTKALLATLGLAAVFGAIGAKEIARQSKETIDEIIEYVKNHRGSDGLNLSDRLRAFSGLLRGEIGKEIRYAVLQGKSVKEIGEIIRKTFDKFRWHIKRIITTEIPIAVRKGISVIGGKLKIVKAVKIHDNRGRHRNHESHECYRLAEQNVYGWGKGVYKPTDTYIFEPHPQCTAYFTYIFDSKALADAEEVDTLVDG